MCDCHSHENHNSSVTLVRIGIGVCLFVAGLFIKDSYWLELGIFLVSYLLVGGDVLINACKNIIRGQIFDENFLMTLATVGAFSISEFPEAVAVMLFYQVGEHFQDAAVTRSRQSITSLLSIRPDFAHLKLGAEIKTVSPEDVPIGSHIIIKPGERIPLDARVIEGSSGIDTSSLTGESIPRDVCEGDDILSGSININGLLVAKTTKLFSDSTISKILDMVENAAQNKAPAEKFITKFAKIYTPIVVFLALGIAFIPPLVLSASISDWVYRALVFLVVSCPCALVISIPLGYFGGIGGASRNGILIKGSSYLDALKDIDCVVFDKTGTLTKGTFTVSRIVTAGEFSQDQVLKYAAYAEYYSGHPIARSIVKRYTEPIDIASVSNYTEISGKGISAKVNNHIILAGNATLLKENSLHFSEETAFAGAVVYIAIDGKYAGAIMISDQIKSDSYTCISSLKNMGISDFTILTGDNQLAGESVAKELGINQVYTSLLPHQKVEKVEEIKNNCRKLAFAGDGINDAPVLALADIGIAMGGLGSDAAIQAADIVIMNDEPSKIATAVAIAVKTRRIITQNIVFALGIKILVMLLGAMGIASMWFAVFADVGVALLAIMNSMRMLKKHPI